MSVFLPMSCHGCMLKIADGTSKIISGTEKCIMPIDKCMWKYPSDVPNGMKMRSKVNNKPTAGYQEVFCCEKLRWVMGKKDLFFLYNKIYLIYNY